MATQDSRIRIKRSTTTGQVPTVAPSTDHTDGTWDALDIYVGELFANVADNRLWVRTNTGIRELCLSDPADPCYCVHVKKLTLTNAQVLTLNGTPIQFGITVPTGCYIKPLSCDLRMQFNTTSYNNEVISIQAVGSTVPVYATTFEDTISVFRSLEEGSFNFDSVKYVANADFEVYAPSANPTSGDSNITLYLTYVMIPV